MGSGPGEEGVRILRPEDDKPVVRPEPKGMPGQEDSGSEDEVYIPDYVMIDFGTPENSPPGR